MNGRIVSEAVFWLIGLKLRTAGGAHQTGLRNHVRTRYHTPDVGKHPRIYFRARGGLGRDLGRCPQTYEAFRLGGSRVEAGGRCRNK